MITFGAPWMGIFLVLLFPTAYLIGRSRRQLRDQQTQWTSMGLTDKEGGFDRQLRRHTRRLVVYWVTLASLILGLMQPHVNVFQSKAAQSTPPFKEKMALAVVVDTSLSMGAHDIQPSRLGEVIRLLQGVSWPDSMSVGLGTFEGIWKWQMPLGNHRTYFKMGISTLKVGQLPLSGSSLKSGLEVGLDILGDYPGPKRMVLLSDGGDGVGVEALIRLAQLNNIPIDTIGIGGARPVPIPNPYSPTPSLLMDPSGGWATTQLHSNQLKEIAKMTGGTYYQNPRRFPLRILGAPSPSVPRKMDDRWVWITLGILLVGAVWINSEYGSRSSL